MGKGKRKKNRLELDVQKEDVQEDIIPNLPEKFLHMNVKAGTKMRKVLEFAMKEFQNHNAILWTAAGEGVRKTISCVEIFKRQNPGLHQVTKLGSIKSKKSLEEKDKDGNVKIRYVAQINILLTREATHKNNPGYQAPDDIKMFWNAKCEDSSESSKKKKQQKRKSSSGKLMSLAPEEFAEMGLPTGQKRSRKEQHTESPSKKNKVKEGDNR